MTNSERYRKNRLNAVFDGPHTSLTLESSYGQYIVTVPRDDLLIGEIIDDLVRPILLASGYHEESINSYILE